MEQTFLADGGSFEEKFVGEIFKIETPKRRFDANKIQFGGQYPYVARGESNNGIRGYITEDKQYLNNGNTISFGQDTATMFYQREPYFTGDKIKVFSLRSGSLNRERAQYLITALRIAFSLFSWGASMFNVKNLQSTVINIPYKNGKIAFDYMERIVRQLRAERAKELRAFLKLSNLTDVNLSKDEENALNLLSGSLKEFTIKDLFKNIQQGERVTKAEQISGNLNFVMSGTTQTGVVGSIGNAVTRFPKNAITIDIFGNVFYRNYEFGASDDVGVYWNDENNSFNKYAMLYLAASLRKSLAGRFDYGYKLRASKSHNLTCWLPEKNGKPDTDLMAQIGRAIEKLVIADVVQFNECELAAYESVVQ